MNLTEVYLESSKTRNDPIKDLLRELSDAIYHNDIDTANVVINQIRQTIGES